ncbi:MAG: hypothetical protein WD426_00780 [Anditalea sp.]
MGKFMIIPLVLISTLVYAQDLEGSWKLTHKNGEPIVKEEYIKIYQDGYFAYGGKELDSNKFLSTGGGEYSIEGNEYVEILDFFTLKPEAVGESHTYHLDFKDDKMIISTNLQGDDLIEIWEKISEKEDDLTGNWVITGRKRDGEINTMTPGARRTVKILGGGRFQWIAFNSETKEFSGTGGGTYSASDGIYKENITFFSRDDSRVGATLEFKYEVKDGQWHHSGESSTGEPIYEIWSKYKEAYTPNTQ